MISSQRYIMDAALGKTVTKIISITETLAISPPPTIHQQLRHLDYLLSSLSTQGCYCGLPSTTLYSSMFKMSHEHALTSRME